jgi:rhodanese-related sulfurtransferase
MKRTPMALVVTAIALLIGALPAVGAQPPNASGRLVNGYRILTIPPADAPLEFTVYRGDYVKFELPAGGEDRVLTIPDLGVEQRLTARPDDTPHVTMRRVGKLTFRIDQRPGTITIVDFQPPHYRELSAAQAADMIARSEPLILDVRTPQEFKTGHLPNAVLLPVQALQQQVERLAPHRDREILVYCATGNRSTVASKILIDAGFKQVASLRHGIVDWHHRDFPVVP